MDHLVAPFTGGLLTGLREGVEAALIVGIIAGYLVKIGRADRLFVIWAGVGLAVLTSTVVGIGIFVTFGALEGDAEKIFEAAAMLLASAVVTWMLFWMRRQAASMSGELRQGVDKALVSAPLLGLGGLAFTAVIREGIETSLFLIGQAAAVATTGDAVWVVLGAIAGLALAVGIGAAIFKFGARLNLQRFFSWTGAALIIIAAGLLSHGVHELIELGLLPPLANEVYNLSAQLPDSEGIGLFLRAVAGYSAAPELLTLLVHVAYLCVGLFLYLRPVARPRAGVTAASREG
jgi:high-affinity iron transporter